MAPGTTDTIVFVKLNKPPISIKPPLLQVWKNKSLGGLIEDLQYSKHESSVSFSRWELKVREGKISLHFFFFFFYN